MLRFGRWFLGLLTLTAFLAWGASSRGSLSWTRAPAADGSQTVFNVQDGCWRWIWGESGTILAARAAGWRFDRSSRRNWDWWFEFDTEGPVQTVQIPLWPVVIVGAMGWWMLWRREWYVPQRA